MFYNWRIRRQQKKAVDALITISQLSDKELDKHVASCPHAYCRRADTDNCDDKSFCGEGRRLFSRSFDAREASEDVWELYA